MRAKQVQRAKKLMLRGKLRKQKIVATVSLVSSMAFLLLFRYATIAKEFSTLTEADFRSRQRIRLNIFRSETRITAKFSNRKTRTR